MLAIVLVGVVGKFLDVVEMVTDKQVHKVKGEVTRYIFQKSKALKKTTKIVFTNKKTVTLKDYQVAACQSNTSKDCLN